MKTSDERPRDADRHYMSGEASLCQSISGIIRDRLSVPRNSLAGGLIFGIVDRMLMDVKTMLHSRDAAPQAGEPLKPGDFLSLPDAMEEARKLGLDAVVANLKAKHGDGAPPARRPRFPYLCDMLGHFDPDHSGTCDDCGAGTVRKTIRASTDQGAASPIPSEKVVCWFSADDAVVDKGRLVVRWNDRVGGVPAELHHADPLPKPACEESPRRVFIQWGDHSAETRAIKKLARRIMRQESLARRHDWL